MRQVAGIPGCFVSLGGKARSGAGGGDLGLRESMRAEGSRRTGSRAAASQGAGEGKQRLRRPRVSWWRGGMEAAEQWCAASILAGSTGPPGGQSGRFVNSPAERGHTQRAGANTMERPDHRGGVKKRLSMKLVP